MKKILFLAIIALISLVPGGIAQAANNSYVDFNVDKNYDATARSKIEAALIKTTPSLYFYIEKSWWDGQVPAKKDEIYGYLDSLSNEFTNKIYPVLTSVYGAEWRPGVDGDPKITIFFHAMRENFGGYFRSADEYITLQVPDSNEREMLYLPIAKIDSPQLKMLLAHEFVHLIIFNQKNKMQSVQEEVWLNEARADYAPTILGYDNYYEGSNLQKRVRDFINSPSDSLTEWQESKYDYAVINVFFHYLVDHYGINMLSDSLKSKLTGIESINEVLLKNGYKEDFSDIFTNWTLAVIVNDCSLDLKYCYLSENLKNLRINSTLNFLPLSGDSSLSVSNITKNWSGNWQKIIGGTGDLKLEFSNLAGLNFKVPYIVFDKDNKYSIHFLKLDKNKKGEINIKDFGTQYNSLIIIPSLQEKTAGFNGSELAYPYTFKVSITGSLPEDDPVLIQKLLEQIDSLKKQIAALQAGAPQAACAPLTTNLYAGASGNDVRCLQQFLKMQGIDIYPEGLVTGVFGALTKVAVARFQEKYRNEILAPIGLSRGTGFVGYLTRQKINQLLIR